MKHKSTRKKTKSREHEFGARNSLEHLVFGYKQAVGDAAEGKLSSEDKEKVTSKCEEVLKWLDSNATAEKEEFEYQLQELQKVCSPVMAKLHGAAAGGPSASQSAEQEESNSGSGPTIEEMD